ncbi:hypothetical protein LCGC14_0569340 [marine sediment metagenome]|uniref:Uncharacterized protein n=1 Tax=marine sediment metagenome TaxID=412755 RepID=A0A0F9RJL1_9ZZZZ
MKIYFAGEPYAHKESIFGKWGVIGCFRILKRVISREAYNITGIKSYTE